MTESATKTLIVIDALRGGRRGLRFFLARDHSSVRLGEPQLGKERRNDTSLFPLPPRFSLLCRFN